MRSSVGILVASYLEVVLEQFDVKHSIVIIYNHFLRKLKLDKKLNTLRINF